GSSLVLFALGGLFAYLTLSKGLRFLLGFAGNSIVPLLTVDRFINFVIFMVLAFGLSFEFPLILIRISGNSKDRPNASTMKITKLMKRSTVSSGTMLLPANPSRKRRPFERVR